MSRLEQDWSRRLLLRGTAGFTLGLPPLLSLISRKGYGADATLPRRKRFVCLATSHGGIWRENMWPADAMATDSGPVLPGHDVRWGRLRARREGADAVLSNVLRAPATVLTDRVVDQMLVMRGWDVPFFIGHQNGAHLGNYAKNFNSATDGMPEIAEVKANPRPTIDQVMAWSPSFYQDLAGLRERSVLVSAIYGAGLSSAWSNPQARNGKIVDLPYERTAKGLFDKLFGGVRSAPRQDQRKPVVDWVLEDYRSLRTSNRRLSVDDRQRLDDHIAYLAELQRKVKAVSDGPACRVPDAPAMGDLDLTRNENGTEAPTKRWQLVSEIVTTALKCGHTRLAVLGVFDWFLTISGSWHQDFAHQADKTEGPQKGMVDGLRNTFESFVLDFVRRLDVEETPGSTYLDNSLVMWSQEAGSLTHMMLNVPIITFGSAGGFFKTGQYLDLRKAGGKKLLEWTSRLGELPGLPQNRWLATVLQSMGVPRSEFEIDGKPGYGYPIIGRDFKNAYVPGVMDSASDVPAMLRA